MSFRADTAVQGTRRLVGGVAHRGKQRTRNISVTSVVLPIVTMIQAPRENLFF